MTAKECYGAHPTSMAHQSGYQSPVNTKLSGFRLSSISSSNIAKALLCEDKIKHDYVINAPPGGCNFFTVTPNYTLTIPPLNVYDPSPGFKQFVLNKLVDKAVKELLECENILNWSTTFTRLTPLTTQPDGNCLLHAASLGMWGFEDKSLTLRAALSTALGYNNGNTFYERWKHNRQLDNEQLGVQYEPHEWEEEWGIMVREASPKAQPEKNLESLDEFHIFILANVLRRPIIVYAASKLRSLRGNGTLQEVNIQGVYLPLLWDPAMCKKNPLPLASNGGHFSALVIVEPAMQSKDGFYVLPMMDCYGKQLPIKFMLSVETSTALVMDYLLLIQLPCNDAMYITTRHIICAKVSIVKSPEFLHDLLHGYIASSLESYRQSIGSPENEKRLKEAEERCKMAERMLRETIEGSDKRIKVAENRATVAEGRLAGAKGRAREAERQLARAEGRAREAEKRLSEADGRAREAERQLAGAERRAREAERRLAGGEGRGAENRAVVAERRLALSEESLRECEEKLQQLETQWVVERREIQLTGPELGRGGWATVSIATFRGVRLAAKCIHKQIISPYNINLFKREMDMAARIRHPNLLQFIGATIQGELVILTELMPTSLRRVLESRQENSLMPLEQVTSIGVDVARALNYLHLMQPHPLIHRDISSANVLLEPLPNDCWRAKVSDYGSVNLIERLETAYPGNHEYSAPEANDPSKQSPKMDIFSFGVLLVEMLTGEFPDSGKRARQLRKIQHNQLLALIQRCLDQKKENRPSAGEIVSELES